MRKPKENEEEGTDAPFFDEFESEDLLEDDDDSNERDPRKQKKPARQRVELRNEVERRSWDFDWSRLGTAYHTAHDLALSRS